MKYGLSDSMGREFEGAPADGEGQGSLACCSPRGHEESDATEQLNWTANVKREQVHPSWLPCNGGGATPEKPCTHYPFSMSEEKKG